MISLNSDDDKPASSALATQSTLDSIARRIESMANGNQVRAEEIVGLYERLEVLAAADPLSAEYVKALIDLSTLTVYCAEQYRGPPIGNAAVSAARQLGDKSLLRYALTSQSAAMTFSPAQALTLLAEALGLAHELEDTTAEAKVCGNIASFVTGLDASETILRHALSLPKVNAEVWAWLWASFASAALSGFAGEPRKREAAALLESRGLSAIDRCFDSVLTLNSRFAVTYGHAMAAILYAELGDLALARKHADVLVAVDIVVSARLRLLRETVRAELALAEGNSEDGLDGLDRAIRLARKDVPQLLQFSYFRAIRAAQRFGRSEMALLLLRELIDLDQASREEELFCERALISMRLVDASGDYDEARHGLGQLAAQLEREVALRREALAQTATNADVGAGYDLRRSFRLRKLVRLFATILGWRGRKLDQLSMAAQFANIGMVGLPAGLLAKPCRLSEAERRLLSSHTLFGVRLLERAELKDLDVAVLVARHHHERWNGEGYPDGLDSEAIPEAARIVAICDAFDAMVHPRPWRTNPVPLLSAIEEIRRNAGTQFDPRLAERFVKYIAMECEVHGDFDAFLGGEGDESAYVIAREQIQRLLTNGKGNRA